MDLVASLQKKITSLDSGEYLPGLKAVLLHIETAFRHLSRGQDSDDDTAFTDAIYRTNQAFEGSIKEAYRVLADQDPAHKRPYDIESYLEKGNVFRKRVLSQFTTYRTDWRNPSAHDYKLDFDESEAFLAIVSVTAFACLLLDQIAERLAFNKSKAEAEAQKQKLAGAFDTSLDVYKRTVSVILEFCRNHMPINNALAITEVQMIGSLHGFFASAAPDLTTQVDVAIGTPGNYRVDLTISSQGVMIPVEVKRSYRPDHMSSAIQQVFKYTELSNASNGILLCLPTMQSEMVVDDVISTTSDTHIAVIRPKA